MPNDKSGFKLDNGRQTGSIPKMYKFTKNLLAAGAIAAGAWE